MARDRVDGEQLLLDAERERLARAEANLGAGVVVLVGHAERLWYPDRSRRQTAPAPDCAAKRWRKAPEGSAQFADPARRAFQLARRCSRRALQLGRQPPQRRGEQAPDPAPTAEREQQPVAAGDRTEHRGQLDERGPVGLFAQRPGDVRSGAGVRERASGQARRGLVQRDPRADRPSQAERAAQHGRAAAQQVVRVVERQRCDPAHLQPPMGGGRRQERERLRGAGRHPAPGRDRDRVLERSHLLDMTPRRGDPSRRPLSTGCEAATRFDGAPLRSRG